MRIAALLVSWLMVAAGNSAGAAPVGEAAAVSWAQSNAVALSSTRMEADVRDLQFLPGLVGAARVVSFGEAMHGGHEFLGLRNRIFAFLVERMGFTAIAAETGFAESMLVDDYVRGEGELSNEVVAAVFSFGAPRAWQENLELIEWMRAHNAAPGVQRKIGFYGLEMMGHVSVPDQPFARRAADAALGYVAVIDPQEAERFGNRLGPLLRKLTSSQYGGLMREEQDMLTLALGDLVSLYQRRHVQWIARSSALEYYRGLRNALNARNLDADFRASGWWIGRHGDRDQRDASSAASLRWVLDREGPRGRVFVFAHNAHVREAAQSQSGTTFTSMGEHLDAALGEDLITIGSVYKDGEHPMSINAMLDEVGLPLFALDFAALARSPEAAAWWNQTRSLHQQSREYRLNAIENFDALIFVDAVTPAQPIREQSGHAAR